MMFQEYCAALDAQSQSTVYAPIEETISIHDILEIGVSAVICCLRCLNCSFIAI
jgi:hypothetical protein